LYRPYYYIGPSPQGEPPQPSLVWLNLRPPYYVQVLANKLLNFKLKSKYTYEPRPDIVTTEQVRRMLGFETTAKTNVHSVIREAIQWGVLSPALKKDGKIVSWLLLGLPCGNALRIPSSSCSKPYRA